MGHVGSDRVLHLARERFYFPRMQSDGELYVKFLCRCVKQKPTRLKTRVPLQLIISSSPFELVSIEFLLLEKSSGNKTAKTVADNLYLVLELKQFSGVQHSCTTPYHPQGNGQVEWCNRMLLDILRTLPDYLKSCWKDHVNRVLHTYNYTERINRVFTIFPPVRTTAAATNRPYFPCPHTENQERLPPVRFTMEKYHARSMPTNRMEDKWERR